MDRYSPIQGISLERYAELGAEISECPNDPEQQARIVESKGVARADWEAAKAGWTQRMQDPSDMGQLASRYMSLYQAALARKRGPAPQLGFEDYVALSGCAKALGLKGMLAHYGLDMARWTQIAGEWNGKISADPARYGTFGLMVEQEGARIQAGGAPRPVAGLGAGAAQPGAPMAQAQPAHAPTPAYAQAGQPHPQGYPQGYPQPQQQSFERQAAQVGQEIGKGLAAGIGAIGAAFQSFGKSVTQPSVGSRVAVTWSDGNRYPGTVVQVAQGHYLVQMGDGQQHWIPAAYVASV
jgi:hypothetical protein